MEVLDLCCGHGRIANRLAARGVNVTGLDASEHFLAIARTDARDQGLDVSFVHGDMRDIPWTGRFDRVINWFTSFGYFTCDDENRAVLQQAAQSLKPAGILATERISLPMILKNFQRTTCATRDGNAMVDRIHFNFEASRTEVERSVYRDGQHRSSTYTVRHFMPCELRTWLVDAGFSTVRFMDESGGEFGGSSRRLIAIAAR